MFGGVSSAISAGSSASKTVLRCVYVGGRGKACDGCDDVGEAEVETCGCGGGNESGSGWDSRVGGLDGARRIRSVTSVRGVTVKCPTRSETVRIVCAGGLD